MRTADWDIKSVKPLEDHQIYVELTDGRHGVFDLTPYLGYSVFRELQDPTYFKCMGIQFDAVF